MTVIVDAEYVTNFFLYGSPSTPSDLTDASLIRPANTLTSFVVDGQSYMNKVGRFALPSQFELIQNFFSVSYSYTSKLDSSGNVTYWTKQEIADMLGLSNGFYGLVVRQFEHDDGLGDYAERTLVWNSGGFKISDDAQFWIDADGTRHIENFAIVPIEDASGIDENFDLNSDSIITQIGNDFLLKQKLDPYNIGRRVNMDIQGDIVRTSYNVLDYTNDLQTSSSWTVPTLGSMKASVDVLLDDLRSQGIISPVDGQGRPIEYGTTGNDNLTSSADQFPYYENLSGVGSVLIGGAGIDVITGSSHSDRLIGGGDDDTLAGLGGNDLFDYSTGKNKIWGNGFLDYSTSLGELDIADYSKTDKNLSVKFYSDDDHPYTVGVDGGNGNQDSLWSIEKIIGGTGSMSLTVDSEIPSGLNLTLQAGSGGGHVLRAPNQAIEFINSNGVGYVQSGDGKINLIGFTTDVIGSWDDDIIDDVGSGRKRIFGGGGNDTIHADGASVMIDGGDGDDVITGGIYNDVLIAGEGTDILNGGGGSDRLTGSFDTSQNWQNPEAFDRLNGGDGSDLLVSGRIMSGDGGNDVIDATAYAGLTTKATVIFKSGDGNDWIMGDGDSTGISYFDLTTIDSSSVTIYWGGNPVNQGGNFYEGQGTLSVVLSSGDSISIGNVRGGYQLIGGQKVTVWFDAPGFDFSDDAVVSIVEGESQIAINYSTYSGASAALGDLAAGLAGGDVDGTSGDDEIDGSSGDDDVSAGDGDDGINLSGGDDTINGGDGNDTVTFFGSIDGFTLQQVGGGVRLISSSGLEGATTVTNVENFYSITDDRTWTLAQIVGRISTVGNDDMIGTDYDDDLFADAGDDTLKGFGGNDFLDGGDGNDQAIYAGSSSDYDFGITVDGDAFVTDLIDGEGTDQLRNIESIYFEGDQSTLATASLPAIILGSEDSETITGTSGADRIISYGGNDEIFAGAGDDIVDTGADSKMVDGEDGIDTLKVIDNSSDYDLYWNYEQSFYLGNAINYNNYVSAVNIENIFFKGDNVTWSASELRMYGTAGSDNLVGSSISNYMSGLDGDDTLSGGDGHDMIDGGSGDDQMIGGAGDDGFIVDSADDLVVEDIDEGWDWIQAAVSYVTPDNVEGLALTGSAVSGTGNQLGNDIYGNGEANLLNGLGGDDYIYGGEGNDQLAGGVGNDDLSGGDGSSDVAVYAGLQSSFTIATVDGVVTVTDNDVVVDGDEGTDTLYGIEIAEFQGGIQTGIASPIILDLNGNGVTLINNDQTRVGFDWNGDTLKDQTGWIGEDDGFLFIDRDGNGTVTNAGELSFTSDKEGAKSDLDGLRAFDSNGDGIFSSADDQFADFKVWRDQNGNGRVDKREILSLQVAGVASIDLTGQAVNQAWEWGENITVNTGAYTRTDGTAAAFSDVALSYDIASIHNAARLPPPSGSGAIHYPLPAIQQAASQFSEAISAFENVRSAFETARADGWSDRREVYFGTNSHVNLV